MIISHELKFIFIHVHRTGGTTLKNLLITQTRNKVATNTQHGNARTAGCLLLEKHSDYFVFGFVRNPWERMLSWYSVLNKNAVRSLEQAKKDFEDFLQNDIAVKLEDNYFHPGHLPILI